MVHISLVYLSICLSVPPSVLAVRGVSETVQEDDIVFGDMRDQQDHGSSCIDATTAWPMVAEAAHVNDRLNMHITIDTMQQVVSFARVHFTDRKLCIYNSDELL